MPFHHRRHPGLDLGGRGTGAGPDGAGDIGGAVEVLAAGIDQIDLVRPDRAVGFRGNAVVDDGAMLPRAGNGREAFAAEQGNRLPERQQLFGRTHFGGPGALFVDPLQKAAHGDGVALVGVAHALLFHVVLAGFRQHAWVWPARNRCTGCPQLLGEPNGGTGRIDPHGFAGQARQRWRQRLPPGDRDAIAQPSQRRLGQFGRIHEQFRPAIRVRDGKTQRERREWDIPAPNVQKPRDRGRIGQHRRILFGVAQKLPDIGPLVVAAASGMGQGLRYRWTGRRRRAIGPDRVHRVAAHRHHGQAGFGVPGQALLGDQQRIVADFRACRGVLRQPLRWGLFGDMQPLPLRGIGLGGELQDVAAIGEHRRPGRQHDGEPGAAGESGQPR